MSQKKFPISLGSIVLAISTLSSLSDGCRRHSAAGASSPTPPSPTPPSPAPSPAVARSQMSVPELIQATKLQSDVMRRMLDLCGAMRSFEDEYGAFPCEDTIEAVKATTGTELTLGTASSNDFFRQLFVTGRVRSEGLFNSGATGTHPPDDDFSDDAHMLSHGECGLVYVAGISDDTTIGDAPLAAGPVIPGTTTFDPKPLGGKAVVLQRQGSPRIMDIDPSGHVIYEGKDLFDPSQPYWLKTKPEIKWPE